MLFEMLEDIQVILQYSYLNHRPYLLPVVWGHRMIRSIAGRRVKRNMKSVVETSFADQETIRKREEVYREWGV